MIEIDEAKSTISVIISLKLIWTDNRITFKFLNENQELNMINIEEKIWMPQIDFLIVKTNNMLFNKVTVERRGNPRMSANLDVLRPNEVYSGSENSIVMTSTYQSSFICSFNMIKMYPFDTQSCMFSFFISGVSQGLTKLVAKNLTTFTGKSVGEYEIRNWTLSSGKVTKDGSDGIKVHVQLGRNIISIIMVTYLPTILINIINQATNYVLFCENYDLIVTVNITSMMVLASIYLSVSNSLPTTASIKPVEIWLLFNISYPFIVIIINIILKVNRIICVCGIL